MNFSGAYSDDKELVRGLQEGESQAFRVLVEKYHVKVIRTCIGFVHSAADAEDIAQDVFIEIFRSVKNFRGDSELSTWLYRISVNKSLNFLRSASRRRIFTLLTGVGSAEKQGVSQDEI
ncbi:MAG: sigma-70 family RNA polymerase sigma factor, partial [Bacteroidetes bacterium]|nr:sigma-70 family RNA polymerase sigma factor [Bacteroidota bacterium]